MKFNFLKPFFWMATLVFPHLLSSAPLPLTSSSLFISNQPGLFRSSLGFSLHTGTTKWVQVPTPPNTPYIEAVYRAPGDENVQAALTVRVDPLLKNESLDDYSKRWLKDYPRFGFDILAAKKVRVEREVAFLLDLVNRENSKQLRQLVFIKNKRAVTLTCRDDSSGFATTLKSCNEIIRSFRW